MRYFLSAGEASGDLHASELIASLRSVDSEAEFAFLGGDLMEAASDTKPAIHYRDMAYMGFSEVLRHLPEIFSNLSRAKQQIDRFAPDALILIDYPSFNLKLAKYAAKRGIAVYYYISPKVWAWKEWRVKEIKRYVRRLYAIFPFETSFYARHGMEVDYVGNPSVEELVRSLGEAMPEAEFRECHSIEAGKSILALVPGSRMGEIRNNLPIMDAVARRHPEYHSIIAGAPGIDAEVYSQYSSLPVVEGATHTLLKHATIALVTSGTATLEAALADTPQVVCYRANGSKLSYNIMRKLIKGKYVSLPNLIVDSEVIPEMLLHLCTPDLVDARLQEILPGEEGRQRQLDGYRQMRELLGDSHAAATTAQLIYNDLQQPK